MPAAASVPDNFLRSAPDVPALVTRLAGAVPERDAVVFATPAAPSADDPAGIGFDTDVLSYAELDRLARRVAAGLLERFRPGDRVVLFCSSDRPFVTSFFGCLYAGLVAVPVAVPEKQQYWRRLAGIVRDCAAAGVLTGRAAVDDTTAWAAESGLDGLAVLPDDLARDDLDGPAGSGVTPPPPDADRVVILQYTSGSTAEPKGVMITNANVMANADSLRGMLGLAEDSRIGGWLPLFHDMGLFGLLLQGVLTGRSCVLMPTTVFVRRPHTWLRLIDTFNIGMSAAPNFAYELCVRRISDAQIEGLDLSRWHCACNGSEPVRARTLREFAERFAVAGFRPDQFLPAFGMAEATLLISGTRAGVAPTVPASATALEQHEVRPAGPGEAARELVSCGRPNGIEARVVDRADLRTLPDARVGEIWLRGDSVSPGYWDNAAATAKAFAATTAEGQTGFLRTGDLGTIIGGDLYVTGRIKETLIINGRNLYPQDIEAELQLRHDALRTVVGAAFTVPAEEATPAAEERLIVTHEVRGVSGDAALRALAAGIKVTVTREFGVPVGQVALLRPGTVRRTTSGKIKRSEMRQLFLARQLPWIYSDGATPSRV